ncbi:MAG: Flp pilus assembly protein CpaB [Shimia sp.]
MRAIFGFVLMIGLALAGGAVYLANGYISQHQAALAAERSKTVPLTEAAVVTEQVRYGQQITQENVRILPWPVPALPEGAFTSMEDLFPEGDDEPRVVLRTMEAGEPILAVKVTEPGADAGITSRLARGMRAFAINVDVSSGVSGFLRPGDRVDVYWTGQNIDEDNFSGGDVTKLILTNIQLIAVDQQADADGGDAIIARTVTVQATPQHVAALAQAQVTGQLTLALVGASDDTVAQAADVDQNVLLGVEEREIVAVKEEEVCTIRTRRGAEVVEIPIPCTN